MWIQSTTTESIDVDQPSASWQVESSHLQFAAIVTWLSHLFLNVGTLSNLETAED